MPYREYPNPSSPFELQGYVINKSLLLESFCLPKISTDRLHLKSFHLTLPFFTSDLILFCFAQLEPIIEYSINVLLAVLIINSFLNVL